MVCYGHDCVQCASGGRLGEVAANHSASFAMRGHISANLTDDQGDSILHAYHQCSNSALNLVYHFKWLHLHVCVLELH